MGGRRRRIFHHEFDGEGFEVNPGHTYVRAARDEPYAALVWSGQGDVCALSPDGLASASFDPRALTTNNSEFLVTPGTTIRLKNTGKDHVLLVYTVLPISKESFFVSPQDWEDGMDLPTPKRM